MRSPRVWGATYPSNSLVLEKTFTQAQKLSFDYKSDITYYSSYMKFYIKDVNNGWNFVEYLYKKDGASWLTSFNTFTTPLLPAWDYEFKWYVYTRYETGSLYLDNLQFID